VRGSTATALGVVALSVLGQPGAARAELAGDARRVESAWQAAGLRVERRAPVFLDQGRLRRVLLPEGRGECVSVAVIGPRASEFMTRPLPGAGGVPFVARPQRSEAGLIAIARCGDERDGLGALVVELRSARATLEVIVATGDRPAPEPVESLPERAAARLRPPSDPGRAPLTEGFEARAGRAERRARAEGASEASRGTLAANEDGQGRALVALAEGCHRVELLADAGRGGLVADLDAELRDMATGQTLLRDRSDSADARLELCTGEAVAAQVFYGGAAPRAKVSVVQSRWPLSKELPSTWGARARAAMAMALWRRKITEPGGRLIARRTGVGGTTATPLEITPGSCYLAIVGLGRGDLRSLSLSAMLEGRPLHEEASGTREGGALAFCSREATVLPLTIEARGANVLWGLGLWRVGPASLREAEAVR
jgi:hypothetical protein